MSPRFGLRPCKRGRDVESIEFAIMRVEDMNKGGTMFSRNGGYVIFLIVVVSLISFVTALFTNYSNDDYYYLGLFSGENATYDSWASYPASVYLHWMNLNGRAINFVCELFSLVPRWVFALFSGLMTAWMLVMVIKMMGFRSVSILGPVSVMAFCLICLPWWNGMSSYAYFMNYVWVTPFVFWYIRFLRPEVHLTWLGVILLVPVGIVAGTLHEAMTMPLLCGFIAWFIMNDAWRTINLKLGIMLGSFALGVLFVFCAPGAWYRLGHPYADVPPLLLNLVVSEPLAIAVVIYICGAAMLRSGRREIMRLARTPMAVFVVAMVASMCFSAVGGIIGRGGWYAEIFALIVICRWLNEKRAILNHNLAGVLTALLSVLMVSYMAVVAYWQVRFYGEVKEMTALYKASPDGVIFMDYTHDNVCPPGRALGVDEPIRFSNKLVFAEYYSRDRHYPIILPEAARDLDFKTLKDARFPGHGIIVSELPKVVRRFKPYDNINIVSYEGKRWVAETFTHDGREFHYLTPDAYHPIN